MTEHLRAFARQDAQARAIEAGADPVEVLAYDPDDDEWAPAHRALGKAWCRPCAEWHSPPECWIDTEGVPRLDQPTT